MSKSFRLLGSLAFALGFLPIASTAFAEDLPNPGYVAAVRDAKTRIKEVDPVQAKVWAAAGEKYTLLDVREEHEWAAGHVAGAVYLSRGTLEKYIETKVPDKQSKVILYCHTGARSAMAADTLQRMGYTNVYSVAGGLPALEKAGFVIEK